MLESSWKVVLSLNLTFLWVFVGVLFVLSKPSSVSNSWREAIGIKMILDCEQRVLWHSFLIVQDKQREQERAKRRLWLVDKSHKNEDKNQWAGFPITLLTSNSCVKITSLPQRTWTYFIRDNNNNRYVKQPCYLATKSHWSICSLINI